MPMSDPLFQPERSRAVIARQLAAYNARDLEAFMACWHADAQLFLFPGTILATGAAEIRERHAARFGQPHLRAKLVSRHVAATIVSDHEIVTRTVDGEAVFVAVIPIYEVGEDGLIWTARFAEGPFS